LATRPLTTDQQAEKAAAKVLQLDLQYEQIEIEEKAAVRWLEEQIAVARRRAATRKAAVDRRRKPLKQRLLSFANKRRGSHRTYTLPSGVRLEVWTSSSVQVVGGDDRLAIDALEAAGYDQFIRRPPAPAPELDRQSLKQVDNRHVIDEIDVLELKEEPNLKVKPPA